MKNVYLESIILIAKITYSVRYYILRYDHHFISTQSNGNIVNEHHTILYHLSIVDRYFDIDAVKKHVVNLVYPIRIGGFDTGAVLSFYSRTVTNTIGNCVFYTL